MAPLRPPVVAAPGGNHPIHSARLSPHSTGPHPKAGAPNHLSPPERPTLCLPLPPRARDPWTRRPHLHPCSAQPLRIWRAAPGRYRLPAQASPAFGGPSRGRRSGPVLAGLPRLSRSCRHRPHALRWPSFPGGADHPTRGTTTCAWNGRSPTRPACSFRSKAPTAASP